MELEEVKSHYRNKITEMEGAAKKQERKGTGVARCFLFMSAKSLKELRWFLQISGPLVAHCCDLRNII